MKRVFLALNLPEKIKEELLNFQKLWPTLPCKWVKKENLHITLLFLGNLNETQLKELQKKAQEIALQFSPFFVFLEKITYGPQIKKPRMVWVKVKREENLLKLEKKLKEEIFALPSFKYKQKEEREFLPHITLARLKSWEFQRLDPQERPEIKEDLSLKFEARSFEIMESKLKRGGAEYFILESFGFKI